MSWIDDIFNGDSGNETEQNTSWIDDIFSGSESSKNNDYYDNSPSQFSDGETTYDDERVEIPELAKEKVKEPEYSVQAAAEEANGGKSNLETAIAEIFEGQGKSELQQQYEDANILQKAGMLAKGIDRQAYNQFMGGISGTAASLLGEGTIADKIYKAIAGQDAVNPVSQWNEARQKRTALDQQEFAQMTSGDKASSAINKYGTMAWSQAPSAMLAIMMAPISATAGATTAGLEYASSVAQSAGLQRFATVAAHGLKDMVSNPQFLLSYSQEAGNAYNGALQDGATPEQASLYASLYGTFSAMIENGGVDENLGGMQNYPKAVQDAVKNRDAKTAAVEFAKSIMGEIGEEWQQGGLENLLKRGYGKDIPWYSTEDPNAVINPKQMLETAKDTAITTALMQGGQHAVMSGINAAQNRLYDAQTQRQNEAAEQAAPESKSSATDAVKAAFGEQADIPAPQAETQQIETPTSSTPQTEQHTWDGESYKGYTLEAGHGHDGDTVYYIISPDGRTVGESSSVLLPKQLTDDVIEIINNDIAKNGQPTVPQTPLSPTTEDAVVTDEVPQAHNNPTPQAPQTSTNSIRLTDQDLADYMSTGERKHVRDQKQRIVDSGESPILTTAKQIKQFIVDAISGKAKDVTKAYGRVNSRLTNDVSNATSGGVNISNYYLELDSNNLRHLDYHTGDTFDQRSMPLTEQDIQNLPDYIDNYDDLIDVIKRKDGSVRLMLGKEINGHSIIIEAVSKGRNALHPITAYKITTDWYNKNYKPKAASSVSTSYGYITRQPAAYDGSPSGDNISQGEESVKIESPVAQQSTTVQTSSEMTTEQPTRAPATDNATIPETPQESPEIPSGELNSESEEGGGGNGNGPWVPPTNQPGSKEPKVSQASTNSMRNTAEQNGATQEDLTYIPKPERESLNNAMNRVAADKVGEMNSLIAKDMWTGEDIDTAMTIYGQLKYDSVNQHDSTAADAWANIVREHATKSGQALQAFAKWARTGKAAQMDIDAMLDENTDLTDEQKQEIKEKVQEFSERYDNIKDENDPDALDNLRKLILEQNEFRKTGTFGNKNFEKLLNKETDFNWLKEYAIRQMRNIPADYTEKPTLGQKLKTWQVNAQLSRIGTFFRNLGGNATFGIIDTLSQDLPGVMIDNIVSKYTGKREVAFDKSWLNKNAREAAIKAGERSILEVAGDVDMTGDPNRYGQTSGRTNKMVGNEAQRFMSRWEQLLGYSLTTSDRVFRGQIETSYTDALVDQYVKTHPDATDEEIKQYRAEAAQIAKEVADYRLFQNQGRAAKLSKGAHDLLNTLSIGGENGQGGFGLGDLLNPYPGVPANLAVKALEYSPANLAKGAYEMAKLIKDAKAGKAVTGQQMTAVMDMARGMSGAPIIALFTALVKTGLFRNSDDEDYDVAAEEAAQNLSGVQWNLSATMRAAQGGTADWQEGDDIMKVSWLEPLNAFMSIASLLSESDDDFDLSNMSSKYFEGAIQAALDMPVMENIQNAVNTFKYSSGDTIWQKGLEAGAQLAGDALGGMIPAPVSQTARVTDDYVRDTRGDSKAETAYNAFLNSLPGARNSLPVKTDNFGNARENEPNMLLRTLNSFVLPGAISTFRETAVQDEIGKLYEETGDVALYPDRNGPKSIKVDGIDYPLSAEESRAYHEFVGQKSEEYVQALIDNKAYKTLTTDQKKNAVKEMYELAKGLAKDAYISQQGIKTDTVSDATKLLSGIDKAGTSSDKTALNERNLANYIVYSEAFSNSLKAENYKETDKLAKWYNDMNENLKTVLLERNTDLKRILEYQKIGLGSETYTKIKTAIPDAQNELDANSTTGSLVRLYGVAKADIPEKDRVKVLEQLVQGSNGFIGANAKAAVSTLKQYGLSVEQTAQFFDIALHCATYKDTSDAKDFKGKLTPENTAFALMQIPGLTDAQRTAAYNSIRSQVSNYYNDWKNYTYASEVKWFTNPKNKAAYGTNIKISPKGQNALLASAS